MLLYHHLAEELERYASGLPPESLAERVYATLAKLLELMAPHHETLIRLLGTTLHPQSKVAVLSESSVDLRRRSRAMYRAIIEGATDAPRVGRRQDLAAILYGVHLALVLSRLIDQSAQAQRTQPLLAFFVICSNCFSPCCGCQFPHKRSRVWHGLLGYYSAQ
jgi:hypothetical protein